MSSPSMTREIDLFLARVERLVAETSRAAPRADPRDPLRQSIGSRTTGSPPRLKGEARRSLIRCLVLVPLPARTKRLHRPGWPRRGSEAAAVSLYRTWRPLSFDDLVGQDAVVRTLTAASRRGRLAHAYLFSGTARLGKDLGGEDPGALHRVRERSHRTPGQHLRQLHRDPRRDGLRRDGDRRGVEPRDRRDSQLARGGQVSTLGDAGQSLHHRRGAHAHARRRQRLPQDARRAAAARRSSSWPRRRPKRSLRRSFRGASATLFGASRSRR